MSIEVITPREVPLGGLRAMTVRRTLPYRTRRLIGAWCFLDHYGPDLTAETGGMQVARHPHTGLATVSWLFEGEVDHLDSLGTSARVRPGELNLMTAGSGITHSEFSTPDTTRLHGVQLWLAQPDATRHDAPRFDRFRPEPFPLGDATVRVFLGELAGAHSPVEFAAPVVGAEIVLPGGGFEVDLRPEFEHGLLVDGGSVTANGVAVDAHSLAYLPTATKHLRVDAEEPSRLILLGGEPLGEEIVMWWNFIGRSHAEIEQWRTEYQVEMGFESGPDTHRFGGFPPGTPAPIPAPRLPNVTLRPRH